MDKNNELEAMRAGAAELKSDVELSERNGMKFTVAITEDVRQAVDYIAHLEQSADAGAARQGGDTSDKRDALHPGYVIPAAAPGAGQAGLAKIAKWWWTRTGMIVETKGTKSAEPGYYYAPDIESLFATLATTPVAATEQAIPEGWKLVPLEPTKEMTAAAVKAAAEFRYNSTGMQGFTHADGYRAMVAAAPAAPLATPADAGAGEPLTPEQIEKIYMRHVIDIRGKGDDVVGITKFARAIEREVLARLSSGGESEQP